MTAIEDHCTEIRGWLNFEDYSDVLITSWTRMSEKALSPVIRCKHMIAIDTGLVENSRVLLPSDWLELDFVRLVDGGPLTFRARHDFYNNVNNDPYYNEGRYTITGNYLIVGGDVSDGKNVELSYYEEIPPLDDDTNWLSDHYPHINVMSTLAIGASYSFEDDRLPIWKGAVTEFVTAVNEEHMLSKASGSRMTKKRTKGFR